MNEAIPLGPGQETEKTKLGQAQELIVDMDTVPSNAAKSYREIGAANRAAFKEKIEKKKSWFRDLFSKFGSKVKDAKESAIDHAFATRQMAADGYEAVDKGIQKMEDKVVFGGEVAGRAAELAGAYTAYKAKEGMASANKFIDNKIVNPIDAKVQQGEVWIDKKLEQGKNYAEIKKQQMTAWKQDKVETVQAVGALAAIKTLDTVRMLKEGFQEKINTAKEKVSQGYENVVGMGEAAIAAAEQKRKSLFSAAREKMNQIKLGFLNRQLAQERAKAALAREELEAREAKAKLIEQKMALLNTSFVGGAQEATA